MKKVISCIVLFTSAIAGSLAIAAEPTNIAIAKEACVRYHDSGEYEKDTDKVINQAMQYLKQRAAQASSAQKKLAVVLDIDETALSNYPNIVKLGFGGTLDEIRQNEMKGEDLPISPTLKLYQFAKANHIAVVFISGRYEEERDATSKNLQNAGYANWDKLILRGDAYKKAHASDYKIAMRKQLHDEGYVIIANIGDQQSDLSGGYSEKTFKLPNPYYFIP